MLDSLSAAAVTVKVQLNVLMLQLMTPVRGVRPVEGMQSLKLAEDDEDLGRGEEELGRAAGVGRVMAPVTLAAPSAGSGA